MTDTSLPSWRRRLRDPGHHGAVGSWQLAGEFRCLGGGGSRGSGPRWWWMSRRRSRAPTLRRFYEAGPLSCAGLSGDLDEDCAGREFVDPTGSPSGSAEVDLVAMSGRRPRNRWILVATWLKTARAEGPSTMTGSPSGNARVDLVATPGRRPRTRWCVFVVLVGFVSCGRRVASPLRIFDPHCMVFEPGFPYKLGQLYSIYSSGAYRPP